MLFEVTRFLEGGRAVAALVRTIAGVVDIIHFVIASNLRYWACGDHCNTIKIQEAIYEVIYKTYHFSLRYFK